MSVEDTIDYGNEGEICIVCGKGRAKWIWRCHIDTSKPNPAVWNFLTPYLKGYDAAVFTLGSVVPPKLPVERVEIIPPTIEPVSLVALKGELREPFCGMKVDPRRDFSLEYRGRAICFCSVECRELFSQDPARIGATARFDNK